MLSKILLCALQLVAVATSLSVRQSSQQKTCTVKSSGGKDDSPAIAAAFAQCAKDSTVIFSQGVDYNVLQPIVAKNLSNVTIQMQGNLHLPKNITAVQALVNKTTAATNASALYW